MDETPEFVRIPPNPLGEEIRNALDPRKRPWWIMVFMGIATAALVVIAVMSFQIRDAEREQACYARAAAANLIISVRNVDDSYWDYWVTAWRECEERYQD